MATSLRDPRAGSFICVFFLMSPLGITAQADADFIPSEKLSTATAAPAQTLSCTVDVHGDSFGDQSLKPGVCYLVASDKGVFLDARIFCQGLNDSLGWDVADIEDKVENKLIQDALATLKANGSLSSAIVFWIGQNDLKTENVWSYLNDSSNNCNRSAYLNWETDQPNGGLRQNCMAYFYEAGGNFQDRECDDNTYSYICKVKVTSDTVATCPDFVEDTSTEAPDECLDIWPVAFSNPSVPGVCYAHESYQAFTFEEALSFCGNLPGGSWSVVDIEDADENLFLEAWNRDNFPKNNGYWIGQNDREQEDNWRYTSSGQCPVYLNWDNNQPNGAREQNCMVMLKKSDGEFQDKDCSERRYYSMCKLKKDPGPTQDPLTNCDGSTVPPEVAACSSLHSDAFGSVDNPGVCYFMTGQILTWEQAITYCQEKGWELIDVENSTENEILTARHRDYRPFDLNYWVGQNDREVEGTWKYSSNDTPSDAGVYLNWVVDQPNGGIEQNCIMMNKLGSWEDKDCSNSFYVTCKKRIGQPTTTPAPWTDPCPKYKENAFGDETKPGVCYLMSNEQNTWEEAQKVCQSLGTGWNIPDIEDDADLLALVTVNSRLFSSNDGYWIGQNDRASEGVWVYLDPTLTGSVYERWDSSGANQPDGGATENCAVFQESRSGKFMDVPCGSASYFIACKNRNAYDVSTGEITSQAPTTDAATTLHQTTEGATTPPPLGTTRPPSTASVTLRQTTEGASTEKSIGTTLTPSTAAATLKQTTDGATSGRFLDPIKRSGQFIFLSANATCSSEAALPSLHAKDRFHCARKCLAHGNCRSFSFVASGKEDACELCSQVLAVENLQFKIGSLYYYEA